MVDSWLVWQIADSGFPTGGFAHSGGLEAAWPIDVVPTIGNTNGAFANSQANASCAGVQPASHAIRLN